MAEGDTVRLDFIHESNFSSGGVLIDNIVVERVSGVGIDDFSYYLTDPIGNHHILCKGRHAQEIEAFFSLLNT